jgi:hypothetical protein
MALRGARDFASYYDYHYVKKGSYWNSILDYVSFVFFSPPTTPSLSLSFFFCLCILSFDLHTWYFRLPIPALTSRPLSGHSGHSQKPAYLAPCYTGKRGGRRRLQDQFEAQTARLRETQKAQRPKNTAKAYEPKEKEWKDWCAKLEGNTDG